MISHLHQCIFVHIPKTAGNSINRVFGVGWEDHKDLQRYHGEVPPGLFSSYFKFAVVRNPWDRLLSDYNYQRKKSRDKDSKLFVFTERGLKRNFSEWAEIALSQPDYYEPQRWGGAVSPTIHRWSPQIDWISVEGEPRLDFVARLERLPEDFRFISRQLGLPAARLPHRNRRLHWHYSHYYDRATRQLVGDYYARDIEYFGYDFDNAAMHIRLAWPEHNRVPGDEPAVHVPGERETPTTLDRHPPRGRSRLQRMQAAVVASFVVFIGAWTAPLPLQSTETGGPHSFAEAAVQETFGRTLARYASRTSTMSASLLPANPFAEFRQLERDTPGLHLSMESMLPVSMPLMPVLSFESNQPARSASWPVAGPSERSRSHSGSGSGFRAWFRSHHEES